MSSKQTANTEYLTQAQIKKMTDKEIIKWASYRFSFSLNRVPSDQVTMTLVTATKDLVDALLDINTNNRSITVAHAAFIGRQLTGGFWQLLWDAVAVDTNDEVLNGQTRLTEIRKAGYPPVQFFLARGLSPEARPVGDSGRIRDLKDALNFLLDTPISAKVSAMLKLLDKMQTGWVFAKKRSADELVPIYLPRADAIRRMSGVRKLGSLTVPVFAAMVEALYETDDEQVLKFAEQVSTREMIGKGDPAFALLKRLANLKVDAGPNAGARLQRGHYQATRAALKHFLRGESRDMIRVSKEELEAEKAYFSV